MTVEQYTTISLKMMRRRSLRAFRVGTWIVGCATSLAISTPSAVLLVFA